MRVLPLAGSSENGPLRAGRMMRSYKHTQKKEALNKGASAGPARFPPGDSSDRNMPGYSPKLYLPVQTFSVQTMQ